MSSWNPKSSSPIPNNHAVNHSTLSIYQTQSKRQVRLDDITVADYTIGWIAALPLEQKAAELVFNHDYRILTQVPPGDTNRYTLGVIGDHKIVLAVMPDGQYGKSSASSVATHMLRTFTNVRVGFMVGVGGGAPSKTNDIRLGDIVVSRKGDGKGGVFEFDYFKKHQAKPNQNTSHLNSTPSFVMSTIAGLKADHIGQQDAINEEIEDILTHPRIPQELRRDFERPSEEDDMLFRSNVVHNVGRALNLQSVLGANISLLAVIMLAVSCVVVVPPLVTMLASLCLAFGAGTFVNGINIEGCEHIFHRSTRADEELPSDEICQRFCRVSWPNALVPRQARNPSRAPKIHYGLIGSSDQLMKDAVLRDELATDHNILCFEMEAAGLMDKFPCLVIRGICDYSDSHKNKGWQNYAALAAALYTRAVIRSLPVQQISKERRLADIMGRG
ncbi:hypothetical protein LTR84_012797 [Exophiala bonariae]|uniref:Nucleoside phosphorylase domain-containing protein n=1 Tax=Exophiala bonariae TaxID=1690606 RepID=A0AAV9NHA8_9EURO|nr:hypothetical protein LTR84_012797 [Exophiala bonariae]